MFADELDRAASGHYLYDIPRGQKLRDGLDMMRDRDEPEEDLLPIQCEE